MRFSRRKLTRQQKIKRLQEVFAEELDNLTNNSDSGAEDDDDDAGEVEQISAENTHDQQSDEEDVNQQQVF